MNWLAASLIACWLLASPAAPLDISLPVEHAIGDAAFSPAGQLKGVLSPKALKSTLHIERGSLSTAQQQQLWRAAQNGGFYRVRVGSKDGSHLVASVPAGCLVRSGTQERMMGAVAPSGELIGISFDLSQMSCNPGQLPTAAEEASLAESVPVLVTLPVAAPHIQKELQAPAEVKRGAPAATVRPSGKAGESAGDGKEAAAPPPDNRTWLQKNWIYLLPVGFMLLNGMAGGGARGQQGGGQAQAGAQRQRQQPR